MHFEPPCILPALEALPGAQAHEALIDAAAIQFNSQLDGLTSRLAQALQEIGAGSTDPAQAALNAAAAALLRKNRYPFAYVAAERLRAVLSHELRMAASGVAGNGEAGGALRSLSPETEIDKTLTLGKAARTLEEMHGEQLATLELRLAALFGRTQLEPARHPFRPLVFLTVLHEAWCEFHPDTTAHGLVFPLLGSGLCPDLAPILQALDQVLIKRGILPGLPAPAARPGPMPAEPPASIGGLDAWRPPRASQARGSSALFAWLDALPRAYPEPLGTPGGTEPTEPDVLLHVLRHAPAGSIGAAETKLVELLVTVFRSVLDETAIAAPMRARIASLQLPVLRAALIAPPFLLGPDQPVRRTLELLAELAMDWDPACDPNRTDPVCATIKRIVERIARENEDRIGVFVDAAWDLESFKRREQGTAEHILAVPIATALKEERQRHAERRACAEVALRIDSGEVVAFVETFLEDRWVSVLTLAYTQEDQPHEAQDALKTMDDLVWSVKPKITADERRALLSMLPGMVASLNRWLDRVQWSGAERTHFLSELAACHVSLVRAPLALSPERRAALALEAARLAAERRQARAARRLPDPAPDDIDRHVHTLQCGVWLEFAEPGGLRRLKLAWVSPMRSLFLFATRARRHALSLTDEALAAALREGRARIIDSRALVRRSLGSLPAESANDGVRPAA